MPVLLRVRWLVGHLLIVAMAALMISLGFWQLDRLHQRRAANAEVKSSLAVPSRAVDGINQLPAGLGEYTPVSVTGTWDPAHTVYRRYPIRDGVQGYEVLMPLKVQGGAMIVNRGFIPVEKGRYAARPEFGAAVTVTVQGFTRDYDTGGSVGKNDGNPAVPTVEHTDPAQLRPLMGDVDFCKYWVQLSQPATPDDPLPLEMPALDEGPHLSYALQWFGFTITIIIGWALVCYRVVRPRPEDG